MAVRRDVEEGKRAGVTGTPAFFVNGRFVSGAQSLEAFSALVDDELSRAAAVGPSGGGPRASRSPYLNSSSQKRESKWKPLLDLEEV